jgi:hypothetical protein
MIMRVVFLDLKAEGAIISRRCIVRLPEPLGGGPLALSAALRLAG